jgi:hypothetical protein
MKGGVFMRKMLLWFGITALAAGLSPGAFGLDVPLKYEKAPADRSVFFPYGYGYVQVTAKKPDGDWKLPALVTDKPLYAVLNFGDRNHLLVLDMKKAGDKFYSRLYLDCNGNGDLTDDTPIDGAVQEQGSAPGGGYFMAEFPAVDLTIMVDGARLPYCLQPRLFGQMTGGSPPQGGPAVSLNYMVSCMYSGAFAVGGGRYTFMLSDMYGNGRFTDRVKIVKPQALFGSTRVVPEGDLIYLTDGRAQDSLNGQPLGDLLQVGDTLFEVAIDIAKGKMTLTEIKNDLSPLKLSAKPERLSLYTEDGGRCLMSYKPSGDVIMLPAGSYKLLAYQMFRKDEHGDLWRLNAGGTNESPAVAVAPNSGAVLLFGEPYMPVVTLPPITQRAPVGNMSLMFNIEGAGKELLSDLRHIEGAQTTIPLSKTKGREYLPKEPAYTIVKADGEIVARGSFEYG